MKTGKIQFSMLVKWACVFLMGIFLYFQLNGEKTSETGFAEMQKQVTSQADLGKMQKANNQMIKRLYGLDPTSYSGVLLYYPLTNMGAEELMLIQMKDASQKEAVKKALEARQETQVKSFEGYGVEQTAMLKKSIIDVRSNYALFISGDEAQAVAGAFNSAY